VNPAKQIRESGIHQEVVERIAVRRRNQLHAALSNGSRRLRFGLRPDFIDHDNFGHVVFNRLDHHGMLQIGSWNLHPPARADAWMRNIAITADFVGSIDNNHTLDHFSGQDASGFAEKRGLSDSRTTQQQQALSGFDNISQDIHGAEHSAAHSTGQPNDDLAPVANRRDSMQRALDAGTIVECEGADTMSHILDVLSRDAQLAQINGSAWKTSFRRATEVHYDLDQVLQIGLSVKRVTNVGWHDTQQ
jgi:hypothetical protein